VAVQVPPAAAAAKPELKTIGINSGKPQQADLASLQPGRKPEKFMAVSFWARGSPMGGPKGLGPNQINFAT
jgi:hypothetical protein